jgi:undecaprenyl-diphosphatase
MIQVTTRMRIKLLVAGICALVFAGLGYELMNLEQTEFLYRVDRFLLQYFSGHRSPELTQVMVDLTALGSLSVLTVLTFTVLSLLLALRDRVAVVHLLVVMIGSAFVQRLLKLIYNRERPDFVQPLVAVSDSSFPSGHSFAAASLYITLAIFASRYRQSLCYEAVFFTVAGLIITLVGVSRMYLGVHYPSDVLGGIYSGSAWSLLVAVCFWPYYSGEPWRK